MFGAKNTGELCPRRGNIYFLFEPNRRPAAIACHNSRLYGRLPLAKVVFFVYSHFAPDNKNPHR